MPISKTGIGHSECTADKQEGFEKWLHMNISIWLKIFEKYPNKIKRYYYFDLMCGDGNSPDNNEKGSALIAINTISKYAYLNRDISFYLILNDIEYGNVNNLREKIKAIKIQNQIPENVKIKTYCQDCENEDGYEEIFSLLEIIDYKAKGLVYLDPNGCKSIYKSNVLKVIAKVIPNLDILIRCPTVAIKRCMGAKFTNYFPLKNKIKEIDKNIWLVRDVAEIDKRYQWVFLFATNYRDYRAWKKERWYLIDSKEGEIIMNKISHIKDKGENI